jgi:hypothetical protein
MNETVQDPALVATDPQEMLNKLRAHGGVWHSLAKFLPVLYAKGFDTNTIAEITGVNPVDQNRWVVAGTVYDSIVSTGQVEQAQLGYFDLDGDALLYHFRFLPAERRAAAASYIVANQLDEPVSNYQVLQPVLQPALLAAALSSLFLSLGSFHAHDSSQNDVHV